MAIAHTGRGGRAPPIIGARTQADHRDRLDGAVSVLAEGDIEVLPAVVAGDRADRVAAAVGAALEDGAGITGIYSIGAGNRGLVLVLARLGAARPFAVMHELTPFARGALLDGLVDAVIDQTPAREVALALDAMKAIADGRPVASRLTVTPNIYLRDNLPQDTAQGGLT